MQEIFQHQQQVAYNLKNILLKNIEDTEKQVNALASADLAQTIRAYMNTHLNNVEGKFAQLLNSLQTIFNQFKDKQNKVPLFNALQDEINHLYNSLSTDVAKVHNMLKLQEGSQQQEKYKKELEQAAQRKEDSIKQFHALQTDIIQLKAIEQDMKTVFLRYLSSGVLSVETISPILNRYQVLSKAVAEQKNNQFFNIPLIIYKQFIATIFTDLAVTYNTVQRLFTEYVKGSATLENFYRLYDYLPERFFSKNNPHYLQMEEDLVKIFNDQQIRVESKKFYDQASLVYTQLVNYALGKAAYYPQAEPAFYQRMKNLYQSSIDFLKLHSSDQTKLLRSLHIQMGYVTSGFINLYLQGKMDVTNIAETKKILITLYQDASHYFAQAQDTAQSIKYSNNVVILKKAFEQFEQMDNLAQKEDAQQAERAYMEATHLFKQLGAQQFTALVMQQKKIALEKKQISFSKKLIEEYKKNILPDEQTAHISFFNVGTFKIPEYYFLARFAQQIPVQAKSLSEKKDQESLINVAFYIHVSRQLSMYEIKAEDVFDERLQIKTSINLETEKQKILQNIVYNAQLFKSMLHDRITAKKSAISVESAPLNSPAVGNELVITHYPIFPAVPVEQSPLTMLAYPGYPTAQSYFLWIAQLADPATPPMSYGKQHIVSANMPEVVAQMQEEQAKAFLAAARLVHKRVDYLMQGGDLNTIDETMNKTEREMLKKDRNIIEKLQKIDKNDFSISLKEYVPVYITIQSYIDDAVITYYVGANELLKNNREMQKEINRLQADAYQRLASIAQQFLIGNPQDALYLTGMGGNISGIVADVIKYYRLAIGVIPEKKDTLLPLMLDALTHAGNLLIKQGKLFAALRYYQLAVGILLGFKVQDQLVYQPIIMNFLKYNYLGALDYTHQFRNSFIKPLTITYDQGVQKQIALSELTKKIVTCPEPTINKYECQAYEKARTALLDALIYFQDAGSWVKDIMQKDSPVTNTLYVDFIKQYPFALETVTGIQKALNSDQFATMAQKATETFEHAITQGTQRIEALDFFKRWNEALFSGLSTLYTTLFLKGYQTFQERLHDVLQMLKFERTNIMAPAEQWI